MHTQNILVYYSWGEEEGTLVQDLLHYRNTKFLIVGPEESHFYKTSTFQHTFLNRRILLNSINKGNEIHAILNHEHEYPLRKNLDDIFSDLYNKEITVYPYNTYFFLTAFHRYSTWNLHRVYGTAENPDITFSCLNHRASKSRYHLMDCLAKYDLIDQNAVSWMGGLGTAIKPPSLKYWTPKIITLKETVSASAREGSDPYDYPRCFIDLVTETNTHKVFITEKIARAVFNKKPFIVFGGQGYHQCLKDKGFELFDEIFDYAFDNEPDDIVRADMIVQQLKDLEGHNYKKLYQKLEPKFHHNLRRWFEIALDPEQFAHIPAEFHKYLNRYEEFRLQCLKIVSNHPYFKNYLPREAML